ncbi:MAG: hypothetical protein AAFX78_04960 [Cyanobacteria bacterium J06638_20]
MELSDLSTEDQQFRNSLIGRSLSECDTEELARLTATMRPNPTFTATQKVIHKSVLLHVPRGRVAELRQAIADHKTSGGMSSPRLQSDINGETYIGSKVLTDALRQSDTYHYLWYLLVTYILVDAFTVEFPVEASVT